MVSSVGLISACYPKGSLSFGSASLPLMQLRLYRLFNPVGCWALVGQLLSFLS